MQISQPPSSPEPARVRTGDLVVVRRARWRVVDVRAYEDCQVVTLHALSPPRPGLERRERARFVRNVRWRRACRALVAAETPPGSLRAASAARIELMPHQLEPA